MNLAYWCQVKLNCVHLCSKNTCGRNHPLNKRRVNETSLEQVSLVTGALISIWKRSGTVLMHYFSILHSLEAEQHYWTPVSNVHTTSMGGWDTQWLFFSGNGEKSESTASSASGELPWWLLPEGAHSPVCPGLHQPLPDTCYSQEGKTPLPSSDFSSLLDLLHWM